jgi:hypothetical protein
MGKFLSEIHELAYKPKEKHEPFLIKNAQITTTKNLQKQI